MFRVRTLIHVTVYGNRDNLCGKNFFGMKYSNAGFACSIKVETQVLKTNFHIAIFERYNSFLDYGGINVKLNLVMRSS